MDGATMYGATVVAGGVVTIIVLIPLNRVPPPTRVLERFPPGWALGGGREGEGSGGGSRFRSEGEDIPIGDSALIIVRCTRGTFHLANWQ